MNFLTRLKDYDSKNLQESRKNTTDDPLPSLGREPQRGSTSSFALSMIQGTPSTNQSQRSNNTERSPPAQKRQQDSTPRNKTPVEPFLRADELAKNVEHTSRYTGSSSSSRRGGPEEETSARSYSPPPRPLYASIETTLDANPYVPTTTTAVTRSLPAALSNQDEIDQVWMPPNRKTVVKKTPVHTSTKTTKRELPPTPEPPRLTSFVPIPSNALHLEKVHSPPKASRYLDWDHQNEGQPWITTTQHPSDPMDAWSRTNGIMDNPKRTYDTRRMEDYPRRRTLPDIPHDSVFPELRNPKSRSIDLNTFNGIPSAARTSSNSRQSPSIPFPAAERTTMSASSPKHSEDKVSPNTPPAPARIRPNLNFAQMEDHPRRSIPNSPRVVPERTTPNPMDFKSSNGSPNAGPGRISQSPNIPVPVKERTTMSASSPKEGSISPPANAATRISPTDPNTRMEEARNSPAPLRYAFQDDETTVNDLSVVDLVDEHGGPKFAVGVFVEDDDDDENQEESTNDDDNFSFPTESGAIHGDPPSYSNGFHRIETVDQSATRRTARDYATAAQGRSNSSGSSNQNYRSNSRRSLRSNRSFLSVRSLLELAGFVPSRKPEVVDAVVLDPETEASERKKIEEKRVNRYLAIGLVLGLLLIAIVVIPTVLLGRKDSGETATDPPVPRLPGTGSGPTASPTIAGTTIRWVETKEFLWGISGEDAFELPGSPQNRALQWLNEDPTCLNMELEDSQFLQRYVLAVFYYATDGDNWNECGRFHSSCSGTNFLSEDHECDWFSIECNDNNEVIRIRSSRLGLNGSLPSEMTFLSAVNGLFFSINSLRGTLPTFLANLPELKVFTAVDNDFKGTFPAELLTNRSVLEYLDLSGNDLDRQLPDGFRELRHLTELRLGDNDFTGTIPNDLAFVENLVVLQLDGNERLGGGLPLELGRLANLTVLKLGRTQVGGLLAEGIFELDHLRELHLGNANFTGTLSESFGRLVELRELQLNDNEFSGSVPESFDQLINLRELLLHNNDLTGSISESVCNQLNASFEILTVDCSEVNCTCCDNCG